MSSTKNVQKPLGARGSKVVVDYTRDNTKVPCKPSGAQSSLREGAAITKKPLDFPETSSSGGSPVRPQWTTLAFDSLSDKKGPDFVTLLDPRNISWSSSTSRTWNKSSPLSSGGVWDLPETPPRLSNTPSPGKTRTPFTPITPPSPSLERRSGSKAEVKVLPSSYFDVEVGSNDVHGTWQDEDDFQPKKLFRNCTLELEKISKANADAAPIKYSLKPALIFSPDESQSISSRTRSKTSEAVPFDEPESTVQTTDTSTVVVKPLVPYSKVFSLLELILPHDMYKRLNANPHKCIASLAKKPYTQCGYNHKGSLKKVRIIYGKLAGCKDKADYETMILDIQGLVREAMCGTHQKVVLKEIEGGTRIERLRSLFDMSNAKAILETDQQTLDQWLDTISNPNASTDHTTRVPSQSTPTILTNPRPASPPEQARSASNTAKPKEQISDFGNFTPFQLKRTKEISVSEALRREITRPLGKSETKAGFIYMFWDKKHFGKVKIGRTNDIQRRLQEWNKQCGRAHSYLSQDDRSRVKMPNVGRVEMLIHTELKECRRKRKCEGCPKVHQEWFDEGEVHAVKVVRKWQEWMMQKPYVHNDLNQWVLREEMLGTLEQVCQPVARDKVVVKQARKSEGARRSSKKRGGRKTM